MKFSPIFLLGIVALMISSCASYNRVFSDYEPDVDFSAFETYQVIEHNNRLAVGGNPINSQRLTRAIEREMDDLGYKQSENPDLVVSCYVKVRELEGPQFYYDFYWGWGGIRYVDVQHYQQGTLVLDLIDDKNNRVVWHGKTVGRFHNDGINYGEKINRAVAAIFVKFREDSGLINVYAFKY